MTTTANGVTTEHRAPLVRRCPSVPPGRSGEGPRAWRYPISRWYLHPAARWLAATLAPTRVRPVHLTVSGFMFGCLAAALLAWRPEWSPVAAALVLAAWFFDRTDGELARRQNTVSLWGAWLDANVDELLDVGLHVAVAAAAASQTASGGPWFLLVALVSGKYLFMYGLAAEEHATRVQGSGFRVQDVESDVWREILTPEPRTLTPDPRTLKPEPSYPLFGGRLRSLYHLPGNADVRVHLLAAGLLTGWFCVELGIVAAYYNLRWIARYVLVARRLGGKR